MKISDDQWEQAKKYFDRVLNSYNIANKGHPGVCVDYSINFILNPLLKRYNDGERSENLYHQMLNIK